MRDSCGRTIDYLRLSVTDLCNYRCQYCMPPEGVEKRLHSDILSIEELAEIAAEAAGFRNLKFDTVLIGGFNDDEIEDFVNLSREHPWEMRFIELMPMGPCAGWDRSRFLPAETVLDRMAELDPIEAQGGARRYQLPGALGTVGLISPVSHDFCADCRRIRVTADGKLKGCLHSREEIPLRGLHGQALEDAVRRGILHKPERHHLTERSSDTPRNMNQIGG